MRSAARRKSIAAAGPRRIAAAYAWWSNPEFASSAVRDIPYRGFGGQARNIARIREANGLPPLAHVPPDQDAEEFELHFPNDISLDVPNHSRPQRARGHCALFGRNLEKACNKWSFAARCGSCHANIEGKLRRAADLPANPRRRRRHARQFFP